MPDPEREQSTQPPPGRGKRRGVFKPLIGAAALSMTISASAGVTPPDYDGWSWFHPRPDDQKIGIFNYGHRGSDFILQAGGDIGAGFAPINGLSFGQEDVPLIYQDMEEWLDAGITFSIESWNQIGDDRDKSFSFLMDVVPNLADSSNPEFQKFKRTIIYEKDAYGNPSLDERRKDLEHLSAFFKLDNFLKDRSGRPVIFVFGQDLEGVWDNPGFVETWADLGDEFGFVPILEDYPGKDYNPHAGRVRWFSYASDAHDVRPSGLYTTNDVSRVTFGYAKKGDLKIIPRSKEQIQKNTIEAIRSDTEFVVFVSDDEGVEESEANSETYDTIRPILRPDLAL